jgi:spermidine synthase
MVIELVAARILAPHIGVSLYTWTSIIGVILAGIALGNYLGGKVADRRPSPYLLSAMFLFGGLLTALTLPAIRVVTFNGWFDGLPVMWSFMLKTSCVFFLPAVVLSMVSPMVIKLSLGDLGRAGGTVGTVYAFSTAGAILGTFMTGFYLILWMGTNRIIWLVGAALVLAGVVIWVTWRVRDKWHVSRGNVAMWATTAAVIIAYVILFQFRAAWEETYAKESNYYAIQVRDRDDGLRALVLDNLIHGYVDLDDPLYLKYGYLNVFGEITRFAVRGNSTPAFFHLGGGTYSLPRYLEIEYPGSVHEVVEIDPAVTEVAHDELGLPRDTDIVTFNEDGRLFLIQRDPSATKYDVVVGDVFNDKATPYHLTTLEFNRLVRANMAEDGVYMINIIDDYVRGRYMPSFIHTLRQVFENVYLFTSGGGWEGAETSTYVIAATDRSIELAEYEAFVRRTGTPGITGVPHDEAALGDYLADRQAILLTDDYVPTDILVAHIFR